jgi:hypothetical protein
MIILIINQLVRFRDGLAGTDHHHRLLQGQEARVHTQQRQTKADRKQGRRHPQRGEQGPLSVDFMHHRRGEFFLERLHKFCHTGRKERGMENKSAPRYRPSITYIPSTDKKTAQDLLQGRVNEADVFVFGVAR